MNEHDGKGCEPGCLRCQLVKVRIEMREMKSRANDQELEIEALKNRLAILEEPESNKKPQGAKYG
jgi:hypothetical protein